MRGVNTAAVIIKSRMDLFLETWEVSLPQSRQIPSSSSGSSSNTLETAVAALAGRNVSGSQRPHAVPAPLSLGVLDPEDPLPSLTPSLLYKIQTAHCQSPEGPSVSTQDIRQVNLLPSGPSTDVTSVTRTGSVIKILQLLSIRFSRLLKMSVYKNYRQLCLLCAVRNTYLTLQHYSKSIQSNQFKERVTQTHTDILTFEEQIQASRF